MASPSKKEDKATRRNFDKRTIRKMYSDPFGHAIETRRRSQQGEESAVLQYSAQDVQVYCRKRPINEAEASKREFDVLSITPAPCGAPTLHDCRMHPDLQHAFLANHSFPVPCFDETTSTEQLCNSVQLHQMYDLVERGGHGTVCMFGQTGSGKTFTMAGILKHTAASIFQGTAETVRAADRPALKRLSSANRLQPATRTRQTVPAQRSIGAPAEHESDDRNGPSAPRAAGFEIRVACFEVCGKHCYDLLKSGDKLAVREDASGSIVVAATTVEVKSGQALLEVLSFAASQRVSCATLKNTDSSRSHAFYRLLIKPVGAKSKQRGGSLTFVDLAGSERSGDSIYHTVEQIKQTAEINTSLAALKECVRVRSQQLRSNGKKRVPYRSSCLTMLLRDSFEVEDASGKARTIVIVTVAPGCADTEHTLTTLRNACMMAGLEATASTESRTEVSLTDNEEHRRKFTAQVKHPGKWDASEVAEWFSTACGGAFQRTGTQLPPGLDGKALGRMPEARFRLLCGGDARLGGRLYKSLKEETQRANTSKAAAAQAVRNAKQALGT